MPYLNVYKLIAWRSPKKIINMKDIATQEEMVLFKKNYKYFYVIAQL